MIDQGRFLRFKREGLIRFPETLIQVFYIDLPGDQAVLYASQCLPICVAATTTSKPADFLGGTVPYTFLMCENDNTMPWDVQEKMVKNLGEGFNAKRCCSGHCPFLSQTEKVADMVERIAGEC